MFRGVQKLIDEKISIVGITFLSELFTEVILTFGFFNTQFHTFERQFFSSNITLFKVKSLKPKKPIKIR